jgi:hypothetical protein
MRVFERYNSTLDQFASEYFKEFDFPIVGDILLDIFRHKATPLVDI